MKIRTQAYYFRLDCSSLYSNSEGFYFYKDIPRRADKLARVYVRLNYRCV
jgi:hypothetical protein